MSPLGTVGLQPTTRENPSLCAVADGEPVRLPHDCPNNAWFGARLGGAAPIGKDGSMLFPGLMHGPSRGLVWTVDQVNRVLVLKLDLKAGVHNFSDVRVLVWPWMRTLTSRGWADAIR